MKISVDIDCTPEEVRRFLGLADVAPINEAVAEELTKRAADMAHGIDAGKLMEEWMTSGIQGFSDLQKAFMEHFAKAQDRRE